ncbi:MAG: hypothetical protein EG822_06040 [Deltaproteobacteria bacterium]|nr:hypothetical protein [Deltaproteobacteria bacterium]TLN04960.1 MAG: hypothetical protein FDZ73_01505 [bacterium]
MDDCYCQRSQHRPFQGRHATCCNLVADELKEPGAHFQDREVVVDGNPVTSRQSAKLPAFMRETMKQLGH